MDFKESFLHHIWDQRHLSSDLETISGKIVKIIYQGQYNAFNGPDFKNAVLCIGGETLRGDVEIHQKTSDWTAHQHQEDAAYNNTILHVVFEHQTKLPFTIKEDATQTEILELKNNLSTDIDKLLSRFDQELPFFPKGVCDFFTLFAINQLQIVLTEYGWLRFIRKSNRFNAELTFSSFDQLLYSGFMETMGYEKNKFNTSALAQRFNWDILSVWKKEGLDAISLTAIWLYYAGLTDAAPKILSAEKVLEIKEAWENQKYVSEKGSFKWSLFRIMPANHPVRRIRQAGFIINALLDKGFLIPLLRIVDDVDQSNPNLLVKKISLWINSYIPIKEKLGNIGLDRIKTIVGNCFLPILYLYSEKVNNKQLADKITTLYKNFPPEGDNNITSFMQGYMKQDFVKEVNGKYILQQGLIQLYYMFCNYHLCDVCMDDKRKIINNM